jgi:hypothetical protein
MFEEPPPSFPGHSPRSLWKFEASCAGTHLGSTAAGPATSSPRLEPMPTSQFRGVRSFLRTHGKYAQSGTKTSLGPDQTESDRIRPDRTQFFLVFQVMPSSSDYTPTSVTDSMQADSSPFKVVQGDLNQFHQSKPHPAAHPILSMDYPNRRTTTYPSIRIHPILPSRAHSCPIVLNQTTCNFSTSQQIRGNCSPVSISTTRVPPTRVFIVR